MVCYRNINLTSKAIKTEVEKLGEDVKIAFIIDTLNKEIIDKKIWEPI